MLVLFHGILGFFVQRGDGWSEKGLYILPLQNNWVGVSMSLYPFITWSNQDLPGPTIDFYGDDWSEKGLYRPSSKQLGGRIYVPLSIYHME